MDISRGENKERETKRNNATYNGDQTEHHGKDMGRGRKKGTRQTKVEGIGSGLMCKYSRRGYYFLTKRNIEFITIGTTSYTFA